jgi:hypothetical protein
MTRQAERAARLLGVTEAPYQAQAALYHRETGQITSGW